MEDLAKCNVLVTDKVRRTYKFLCALAKGIPIVTIDWLRDSESAEQFLDWESYILKDPAAEAKFGFRLRKSLDKAKEKKLLDGYTIILTPNVAPPPIEELKGNYLRHIYFYIIYYTLYIYIYIFYIYIYIFVIFLSHYIKQM